MRLGHWVVICDVKDPASAVETLREKHSDGIGRVYGTVCDVSDADSVEALGEFAKDNLGIIHYWINNAGINGGRRPFSDVPTKVVEAVVKVNLVGVLVCTQVALKIMQQQKGVTSHIFNTVGSGVKGGGTPGYVCYGATKRGLPQMTDSLVKELTEGVPGYDMPDTPGTVNVRSPAATTPPTRHRHRGAFEPPSHHASLSRHCARQSLHESLSAPRAPQCHVLSPGMVFTDLLLNDSTPELRKFPFGVLAAQPPEVAADLVPKMLAVSGNGAKVRRRWLH